MLTDADLSRCTNWCLGHTCQTAMCWNLLCYCYGCSNNNNPGPGSGLC